jgi:hypothetical protein
MDLDKDRMRLASQALVVLLGVAAAWSPMPAQTSALYLNAGDQSRTYVMQNGGVINSWAQHGFESGLAVNGTVRSIGPQTGYEYTLSGVFTGATFGPMFSPLYDGATDGVHNFASDYNTAIVYQFGLDWSAATPLFTTNFRNLYGITYDPFRAALWLLGSDHSYGHIWLQEVSLSGEVIAQHALGDVKRRGLAMDYADGSLWTFGGGDWTGPDAPELRGIFVSDANVLGMEFDYAPVTTTPEPTTLGLVTTEFLLIAGFINRRNRNSEAVQRV